ncbi:sensor histidine kinase [Alkaliphilus transvaalensis]|uniref:sensor histidine kinase n=1 Tax=Alkaliphilus transvaalensis TaxID=114628 RepID=UPI000AD94D2E|nr:sensor histidine kinase [Alkaliphilus transvaalensis]
MIIAEMMLALMNKLGIIIILAFIISKVGIFRKLIMKKQITIVDKVLLAVVFGLIGIMGTYSSVPIYGAWANTRIVGVMVGSLLGGPFVGLVAGVIAGGHRYLIDIGGFTALACGIATIVEGLIGGYGSYYIKNKQGKWRYALFIGIFAEIIQMLIILIIARPFYAAFNLVRIILLPMVLVNSMGIAIFIGLIENIYAEQEKIAAGQAEKALKIANMTLPYFRRGLNREVAEKVVDIIYEFVDIAAISITDHKEILAHRGIGEDHHKSGEIIQTEATREVIERGQYRIISRQKDIQCSHRDCRLKSAIVVPLKERDKVVGTLKIYKKDENSITTVDLELGLGLAQLFSTQIELSKVEEQKKFLIESELKTLQAQINPHFLFNAINTIVSFMQFDSIKAKNLLISLSELFRKSLKCSHDTVGIQNELEHIEAYLEIEKARFGDKLLVKYQLDDDIQCQLPPLILQPLVENAIIHGILPKKKGGCVEIRSSREAEDILLEVIDNGVGMGTGQIEKLLKEDPTNNSVGLMNVNKRLVNLYGEEYGLKISSQLDQGTRVCIKIPKSA